MSILAVILEVAGLNNKNEDLALILSSWAIQLEILTSDLEADVQILRSVAIQPEIFNNEEKDDLVNELVASTERLCAGYCYIIKYVRSYILFLQGNSSLPPVWEAKLMLFKHSSFLTKAICYSSMGGDKASTRWWLRELDLLCTYLGVCGERGLLPNKTDCNMLTFREVIRAVVGAGQDLGVPPL